MSHKKVLDKIVFEISELETELNSYDSLIELCKLKEPDLIEKTAVAGVLHSFYTGIENIISAIAKDFDNSLPSGNNWHKALLMQMTKSNDKRDAIISEECVTLLLDYLSFRHFYRHAYSFYLDWDQMEKLIIPIKESWNIFKKELLTFVELLKSKNDEK